MFAFPKEIEWRSWRSRRKTGGHTLSWFLLLFFPLPTSNWAPVILGKSAKPWSPAVSGKQKTWKVPTLTYNKESRTSDCQLYEINQHWEGR